MKQGKGGSCSREKWAPETPVRRGSPTRFGVIYDFYALKCTVRSLQTYL